jgi:hypothetical protein
MTSDLPEQHPIEPPGTVGGRSVEGLQSEFAPPVGGALANFRFTALEAPRRRCDNASTETHDPEELRPRLDFLDATPAAGTIKLPSFKRIDSREKALNVVRREADQDGSPATIDAGVWFVCFVPGVRKQWWHPLVHRIRRHVFVMRPERDGRWTLFEPWWCRLLAASLDPGQARKFLTWAAAGDVVAVREHIPGRGSQLRGWMTCAGLVSYLLGRPYWVWTPHRFYRLLLRELNVWRVDVFALLALGAAELSTAAQMIANRQDAAPRTLLCRSSDR